MSLRKASGFLLWFTLAFLLLLGSISVYSAETVPKLCLSDTSASKGRILNLPLYIERGKDVASFVAEIGYSKDTLEYRGVSSNDNAEVYVNSRERGKLTLVFLCKEGVSSDGKAQLLSLEFKVLTAESSQLTLSVRDAIDKTGNDVEFTCDDVALVTVESSLSEGKTQKSEKETQEEVEQPDTTEADSVTSKTPGSINIFGKSIGSTVFLSVVLLIIFMAIVAVCIAYRLGKKKQKELDFSSVTLLKENKSSEDYVLEYKEEERN